MSLLKEVGVLIYKEFKLEFRQGYSLSSILLYVLSTVFIVYIASIRVPASVWNVLFWIIILFASVNAIAKSFIQENTGRQLYYYTLVNPLAVIFAKIIYNTALLTILCFLTYFTFSIVAGNPVKEMGLFIQTVLLGSLGFSLAFTFISGIAGKTKNSATLMVILGFPVIIPILLVLVKLSANALRLIQDTAIWKDMLILIAIDMILFALIVILFPYLWRD